MPNRLLVAVALLLATVALSAQAFDLKLGQWEYTMSNIKMPPEMLAKMPPSARAAMEKMNTQPQTHRSCLTAEDLKNINLGKTDDEDCTVTSKKITGNVADVAMKCEKRTETMHFEALSRESVRGTVKFTGGEGPSEVTLTGKWVAAACKE